MAACLYLQSLQLAGGPCDPATRKRRTLRADRTNCRRGRALVVPALGSLRARRTRRTRRPRGARVFEFALEDKLRAMNGGC
jgi:hypothetical protein